MIDERHNESRIEAQLERLRRRLAEAWRDGRPPQVIRRLEAMIEHRWRIRDRCLDNHRPLQPA